MMTPNSKQSYGLPFSISRYLCGKWTERTIFVYLIMNKDGYLVDWSENISPFYGIKPNTSVRAEEQLLFLQGMLPYESSDVLILDAVNFNTGRAADIHLVPSEDGELCILMFDVTETLELRRELQQKSNDIQLLYEQELRSLQGLRIAYQEAQKQREIAESSNRAKTEFLSQITHDLKSPLTAILGFAQLLEESKQKTPEEQKEYIHEIKKAGNFLLNLINELLDKAKLENGKIKIAPQSLNATSVVNELVNLLKTIAEKNNITIFDRMNFDLPNVWADPTRFRQIIINFLSNAIKYNRNNGCIVLSNYLVNPNTMRISIKDTGIGIDPFQISLVFEAYERGAAEKSEIEGTGIGLHVCKQLAELMHGSVNVYSDEGQGSIFWLDIPLDKDDVVSITVHEPYKVLYIEKIQVNIDLMTQILKQKDNCVLLDTFNLAYGLEMLEEQKPQLILINACSYCQSYIDFLAVLKTYPAIENSLIVAIFDKNSEPAEIKNALQAGFHDYIIQPFDFNFTMSLFDRLLPQHSAKSIFAI